MSIDIKEVTSRKGMKRFVNFPFTLYKDSKFWIPPLIKGELETLSPGANPAFEHSDSLFLLAYKDGRIAGRIAGIINHRYNQQWNNKDARFGWFDTIDDMEVSGGLIQRVEEWAGKRGMNRLVGPMGFTTFERQGVLVKGYDEMPTFAGAYNFPYYPEHLEKHGFSKEIEYVEYELVVPEKIPEKITKISELVAERYGLRILKAKSVKEMLPYADPVFRVINASYKPLYGFTELTEKQIEYFVKKYFSFLKPDYTSAVLDQENNVLGFQISMPSLSTALQKARGRLFPFGWIHLMRAVKNPDRLDMLLTGVVPEYQSKGVNAVFMSHLTGSAIESGIRYAESNYELEENIKVQNIWRYFESRHHRRSRIYARSLNGST